MGPSKLQQTKYAFFNKSFTPSEPISFKQHDFDLNQLHFEFSSLFQLFQSNKLDFANNPELLLYMMYLCDQLIEYYKADYVRSELEKYKRHKEAINLFIEKSYPENKKESMNKLQDSLYDRLKAGAQEYTSALSQISRIRDNIGNLNTRRSHWSYSKSFAVFALDMIQRTPLSNLIHEINILLGNQVSIGDGVDFLNQTRDINAIISIVLYTLRFTINLGLILKHTIQAMSNSKLSVHKVLTHELEKRGYIMANDLIWSTITLITNYNLLFNISSPIGIVITGVFLIFDAVLLLILWYYECNKYIKRMEELKSQLDTANALQKAVIIKQINLLSDQWTAEQAYFVINILAACIIVISFAVSIIFPIPIALGIMALSSLLGNALYNTANEFKQYYQAKTALQREKINGQINNDEHHQKLLSHLSKEADIIFYGYCKSLLYNVGGITFIITVAVASWPVALCLTGAYIVYQLIDTYQKQLTEDNKEEIEKDIYRNMLVPG